jgi:hypothetical protein
MPGLLVEHRAIQATPIAQHLQCPTTRRPIGEFLAGIPKKLQLATCDKLISTSVSRFLGLKPQILAGQLPGFSMRSSQQNLPQKISTNSSPSRSPTNFSGNSDGTANNPTQLLKGPQKSSFRCKVNLNATFEYDLKTLIIDSGYSQVALNSLRNLIRTFRIH